MKRIRVQQATGIYSQRDLDTDRVLASLPRDLWAVECTTLDGVPHDTIDDCYRNSQGWTGWTFVSATQWPATGTVPLLLFEHEEDAFWAEFRYGSGSRLNTPMEHLES